MEDLQRQPRDKDRQPLVERIKRASDQGRIGAEDRHIRLDNVRSAQSMAELDLIRRELDQSDAAYHPSAHPHPGPDRVVPSRWQFQSTFDASDAGIGRITPRLVRAASLALFIVAVLTFTALLVFFAQ